MKLVLLKIHSNWSQMTNKFVRKLIAVEIKLGFLNVPSQGVEIMPDKKGSIDVLIDKVQKTLSYNPQYRRIFGLTAWYKKHKLKAGDEVVLSKSNTTYELIRIRDSEVPLNDEDDSDELVDISGLSSQAKGDIVEDRIKEIILLHGQGLLSAYRPVSDTGVA